MRGTPTGCERLSGYGIAFSVGIAHQGSNDRAVANASQAVDRRVDVQFALHERHTRLNHGPIASCPLESPREVRALVVQSTFVQRLK